MVDLGVLMHCSAQYEPLHDRHEVHQPVVFHGFVVFRGIVAPVDSLL